MIDLKKFEEVNRLEKLLTAVDDTIKNNVPIGAEWGGSGGVKWDWNVVALVTRYVKDNAWNILGHIRADLVVRLEEAKVKAMVELKNATETLAESTIPKPPLSKNQKP